MGAEDKPSDHSTLLFWFHRVDWKGSDLQVVSKGPEGFKSFGCDLGRRLALDVNADFV